MKPNIKSNAIFIVLLFLFVSFSTSAITFSSDTIIIDNEVIYIEPLPKKVDSDSLDEASRKDIREKKIEKKKFLSLRLQNEFIKTTYNSNLGEFELVDAFLGKDTRWSLGLGLGMEGSLFLNDQFGVFAGIGFGIQRFKVTSIDLASLRPESEVFQFENRDGALWQYYTYPVGIGFENDTTQVSLQETIISNQSWDLPFGVRFFITENSSKQTKNVFIDLGYRFRLTQSSNYPKNAGVLLIASNGDRLAPVEDALRPVSTFHYAQIGLGWQMNISDQWMMTGILQLQFPPVYLNESRIKGEGLRFTNYVLSIGLTRKFYRS